MLQFGWSPNSLQAQLPRPRSESDPRVRTLSQLAAAAKAKGLSAIVIPSPLQDLAFTRGLLSAATEYSIVIATPTALKTDVEPSHLFTWYSLAVEQMIVDHPPVTTASLLAQSLPAQVKLSSLMPVGSGEVLLAISGGTALIDGVTISERVSGDKTIEIGHRYLLILDVSPDHLARLPFGGASIFAVGADGESLTPMTFRSHPVVSDVKSSSFHSLSLIQQAIARQNQRR